MAQQHAIDGEHRQAVAAGLVACGERRAVRTAMRTPRARGTCLHANMSAADARHAIAARCAHRSSAWRGLEFVRMLFGLFPAHDARAKRSNSQREVKG